MDSELFILTSILNMISPWSECVPQDNRNKRLIKEMFSNNVKML